MQRGVMSVLALAACMSLQSHASGQILGTAQSYAVLAGSSAINTGPTTLTGSLGVWPGAAITGFPPGIVGNGSIHAATAAAQQAQSDVTAAYITLAGMTPTQVLTGTDLGGLVLTPGVYFFSSSAFLTGALTLNAQGNPNALFVFQIGSAFTSGSNASVLTINGASACNTYWQVGSSATIGVGTVFQGNILALSSITLATGVNLVDGRALARNGSVTMDTNVVTAGCIPSPGVLLILGSGLLALAARKRSVA